MNKDLLNILSNSNKDIDNQKLMDYLSGKLPESEKHEVERWMADNEFANDAMEGLEQFENTRNMEQYVTDLHKDLGKYIQSKKSRAKNANSPTIPSLLLQLCWWWCCVWWGIFWYRKPNRVLGVRP